ncbi:phosphoglucosamine mutase [bacterium]|nr:phosphoglucosamine mutase [bacterium]
MKKISFGTDGIRGLANRPPITVEIAIKLGQAIVSVMGKGLVIIGGDPRKSSPMLMQAVAAGVASAGGDARIIGIIPTPGVSFLIRLEKAACGVVVSASHNPAADNGLKLFNSLGEKPDDTTQMQIEAEINREESRQLPTGGDIGTVEEFSEGVNLYAEYLTSLMPTFRDDPFSLAVDGANGSTSPIISRVFSLKNLSLHIENTTPNGMNINENCGALYPEKVAKIATEIGANMGIAIDGDGDRLIISDENGVVLDGDIIMGMIALWLKQKGRLQNNTVVTTIMTNAGLGLFLNDHDITMVRASVGDREVYKLMQKTGAIFGGENSGHLIFKDYLPTGDSLLAAIQVIKMVQESGKTLSELSKDIKLFPSKSTTVRITEKPPIETLPSLSTTIKKIEKSVAPGRIIVRYSGTEPVLRVTVEARTEKEAIDGMNAIADEARRVLQ